jgi:transcriptional regulator with XRE-family HTH domain
VASVAIGGVIRAMRLERGIGATELAEKAGVGRVTLSRIENGRMQPTTETLERIASGLGVTVSEIHQRAEAAPSSKGEAVLLMLFRSMPLDRQRWVLQSLAALAAGMETTGPFPAPDEVLVGVG